MRVGTGWADYNSKEWAESNDCSHSQDTKKGGKTFIKKKNIIIMEGGNDSTMSPFH